jgi:hypothetical protein
VHESGNGPSRQFAASQQFGRFRSEADINEWFAERIYAYVPNFARAEVKISAPAIHQAPQTYFGTVATDERGADLACTCERSPRPFF